MGFVEILGILRLQTFPVQIVWSVMRMVGHRHMNKIAQTHSKLHDPCCFTPLSVTISAFDSSNSSSEYSSRRTEVLAIFELFVEFEALVEILEDLLGETISVDSASSSLPSASSENSMFSFFADNLEVLTDFRELTETVLVISELSEGCSTSTFTVSSWVVTPPTIWLILEVNDIFFEMIELFDGLLDPPSSEFPLIRLEILELIDNLLETFELIEGLADTLRSSSSSEYTSVIGALEILELPEALLVLKSINGSISPFSMILELVDLRDAKRVIGGSASSDETSSTSSSASLSISGNF